VIGENTKPEEVVRTAVSILEGLDFPAPWRVVTESAYEPPRFAVEASNGWSVIREDDGGLDESLCRFVVEARNLLPAFIETLTSLQQEHHRLQQQLAAAHVMLRGGHRGEIPNALDMTRIEILGQVLRNLYEAAGASPSDYAITAEASDLLGLLDAVNSHEDGRRP
jgi:hypothetical protein